MTVFSRTWRALGTSVHVLVTDVDLLPDAAASVSDVLGAVDRAYSRFRSDSELSFVNAHPGEPHAVSDLFADALAEALRASELSGGAVDPTVGRAMRVVGYVDDFAGVAPSAGPIALRVEAVPG
jgi:thiamine biosynthesis lipoprotein